MDGDAAATIQPCRGCELGGVSLSTQEKRPLTAVFFLDERLGGLGEHFIEDVLLTPVPAADFQFFGAVENEVESHIVRVDLFVVDGAIGGPF